jgi:hypothetical protein
MQSCSLLSSSGKVSANAHEPNGDIGSGHTAASQRDLEPVLDLSQLTEPK